jgi:hypothetical protein
MISHLTMEKHIRRTAGCVDSLRGPVIGGQVTCIYRAYEGGELVVTGRLTLEGLPDVGDQVPLNGRRYTVRAVEYDAGEPVLALERRS